VEITPGQAVAHDIGYCFSEVTLVFRSSGTPFFNPQVRFSQGSFTSTDFQGSSADYAVYVDADFGMPNTAETAANVGR